MVLSQKSKCVIDLSTSEEVRWTISSDFDEFAESFDFVTDNKSIYTKTIEYEHNVRRLHGNCFGGTEFITLRGANSENNITWFKRNVSADGFASQRMADQIVSPFCGRPFGGVRYSKSKIIRFLFPFDLKFCE